MVECVTCGGRYEDVLPDGTKYFHACPPVYDGTAKIFLERAQKRDENVVVDGLDARGRSTTRLKADGQGVRRV